MIVTTTHIFCDACGEVLSGKLGRTYCSYAQRRVHLHYPCRRSFLPQIWKDSHNTDKYFSAIVNHSETQNSQLTLRNFVIGTAEHDAMIDDKKYYLFIEDNDYYQANDKKTAPCISVYKKYTSLVQSFNGWADHLLALFHKGTFFRIEVNTKIAVKLVEKDGNSTEQPGVIQSIKRWRSDETPIQRISRTYRRGE